MLTGSKIAAYIGFAKKSGSIKCGAGAVSSLKRANLIIVCRSASENAKKSAESIQRKLACKALETVSFTVEELTGKENCKVIAITNADLASAIIENAGQDLKEFFGGRRG
ncbi:MAG TPA: hypothetical protein DDW54_03155 [Clostridiales bacterium]|nr:hypothetical protein [Clostridiales bacterium]